MYQNLDPDHRGLFQELIEQRVTTVKTFDLPLTLIFVIIAGKVCLSPDDVPRPIGEAYDEIGLYKDMDDWSQTL